MSKRKKYVDAMLNTRILAYIIDYATFVVYMVIVAFIIIIIGVESEFNLDAFVLILVYSVPFMFCLKDSVFKNQSIGKRIMGIEIIKNDGTRPSFIVLFSRNFILGVLNWIELIVYLVNGERFADKILNTMVVYKTP